MKLSDRQKSLLCELLTKESHRLANLIIDNQYNPDRDENAILDWKERIAELSELKDAIIRS